MQTQIQRGAKLSGEEIQNRNSRILRNAAL